MRVLWCIISPRPYCLHSPFSLQLFLGPKPDPVSVEAASVEDGKYWLASGSAASIAEVVWMEELLR